MIPNSDTNITTNITTVVKATKTYKVDFKNRRILGTTDDYEALFQHIVKTLNTERYKYSTYTRNYGTELLKLIGKDFDYVSSEVERIIQEALQDERILSITEYEINQENVDSMSITFLVNSIYGDMSFKKEVSL